MSPSSRILRGVVGGSSLALLTIEHVAGGGGGILVVLGLLAVTAAAAVRPDSWWPLATLVGHGLVWVSTIPAPADAAGWALLLAGALAGAWLHLSAAWAASVPPTATIPAGLVAVWLRRGVLVSGLAAVVWLVAWGSSGSRGDEAVLTALSVLVIGATTWGMWRLERD